MIIYSIAKADWVVMYKSPNGLFWRQIMKFQKIDICSLLDENVMDMFKAVKRFYVSTFPELPSKCPMNPGKYSTKTLSAETNRQSYNSSDNVLKEGESKLDDLSRKINAELTPGGTLPNGIYRFVYRFYNDDDPQGCAIYWQTKIYEVMGEGEF